MPSNNGYQQLNSRTSNQSGSYHSSSNNVARPLFVDEICADGTQPPQIKMEDKIVWISDNGPEFGVVKWLGKLPDVDDVWMAGVEFVNPVGSGTGLYNDYKLFETKMNHASLIPIIGLMKASDYLGTSATTDELIPPQKPRRTKKASESYKFYTENKESSHAENSFVNENKHDSIKKVSSNLTNLHLDDNFLTLKSNTPTCVDGVKSKEVGHSDLLNKLKKSHNLSNIGLGLKSNSQPSSVIQNGLLQTTSSLSKNSNLNTANLETSTVNDLFEIGSVVEVFINSTPYYGVIRWLGFLKNDLDYKIDSIRKFDKNFKDVIAGIELEEEIAGLTDGTLNGRRYFLCPINKAYFVALCECSKDSRFCSSTSTNDSSFHDNRRNSSLFGSIDCPTVLGDIAPINSKEDFSRLIGKNRGIQGHHNSCYLDATLFAMFSCTSIFESLLYRPKRATDIPEYNEVQRILKEEIVNPLRANLYVRADRVMHLRQLLERISSVRGLTSEEKDPEEFLNLLLNEILKTDPFLKLSSGLESFFYQLFVEKDESLQIPNVQQLFDQSFLASDIKLREIPSCLMIQMPRFGREFKMYSRIIPSMYLDITNVLENSPRQCIVCGELAEYECKECFGKFAEGLESIAFCSICLEKSHAHKKRLKHKSTKLSIPAEFAMLKNHTNIPRVVMELFAVLCIETSHYVSFVRCGTEPDSPWCFFDSMADRKGEQNGYNIPEVIEFSNLRWWLSTEGYNYLLNNKDEKMIPELPRRLLSDAYICFYSSEVQRYR